MPKFRKLPVVIEAVQNTSSLAPADLYAFLGGFEGVSVIDPRCLLIKTLEGDMRANEGDWIIKGVKGEFYPCKPDIFAATYTPVDAVEADAIEIVKQVSLTHPCGHDKSPQDVVDDVIAALQGGPVEAGKE